VASRVVHVNESALATTIKLLSNKDISTGEDHLQGTSIPTSDRATGELDVESWLSTLEVTCKSGCHQQRQEEGAHQALAHLGMDSCRQTAIQLLVGAAVAVHCACLANQPGRRKLAVNESCRNYAAVD
jgi:hypothetical protein